MDKDSICNECENYKPKEKITDCKFFGYVPKYVKTENDCRYLLIKDQ